VTARTIEERLLHDATGIAALEEGLRNLREKLEESSHDNRERFKKLEGSTDDRKSEATDLKMRLSIADLKLRLERSQGQRWALFVSLLGIVVSSTLAAIIAWSIKPK
jgi:hypothetical protein